MICLFGNANNKSLKDIHKSWPLKQRRAQCFDACVMDSVVRNKIRQKKKKEEDDDIIERK
jgi:uncharacterized protein (UPF0335 family)